MDAVAQKDCIAKIRHSNYESEHLEQIPVIWIHSRHV
jgi:hypothetical protein